MDTDMKSLPFSIYVETEGRNLHVQKQLPNEAQRLCLSSPQLPIGSSNPMNLLHMHSVVFQNRIPKPCPV